MEANSKSHETLSSSGANSSGNNKDTKRQQFTNKQRMDMYAFCVLELEMHSNKVSIKKQQQAIQRVLYEQQKESYQSKDQHQCQEQVSTQIQQQEQRRQRVQQGQSLPQQPTTQPAQSQTLPNSQLQENSQQQRNDLNNCNHDAGSGGCGAASGEGKTLLQLQQEVAMTRKCYSDYQKTQVLTSSMLRDVQKRFSKYYPGSAIPSRSTIKHLFEKCVAHGTVENIRTPRKTTKIPQGDEIEYLLIHEPQLSLRQLAQKLNVSTGTVSRRCKALGLVPESVTIKHQQMATARRQKQIKQFESQSKIQNFNSHPSASNGNHSPKNVVTNDLD